VNPSASEDERLPALAAQLGYAGLIPFVGLSMGLWVLPETYQPLASSALLAYAAIILSFMGAVHWGLAIASEEVDNWQLGISVIPPLVAWFASFAPPMINYSILIVAFAGLCVFDGRMVKAGKAPAWYPKLRTPLTAVVVASLIIAELALL
jgi:hypothetical protein